MAPLNVLIASPLEARHVARMRQVDSRIQVFYRPDLLGTPRYQADHYALPTRSAAEEQEWRELLAQADVLFDFDRTHLHDLLECAPRLRWVQSTSSGVGSLLFEYGFDRSSLIVTNAAGIHAVPLTEFCLMAMLMHVKRFAHMQQLQAQRRWDRFHSTTLRGKVLGIIGLGAIGSELGRTAQALGMQVHGVKSALRPDLRAEHFHVDRLWAIQQVDDLLPALDFVVTCLPHTAATLGRFGVHEFALLREVCFFINIGRGTTVDEQALIGALREQRIAGAALDVVAQEPLADDSPLWTMPNVIICPHSAATVETEDEALTDLFCDNLRAYLDGRPLRNIVDKQRGY